MIQLVTRNAGTLENRINSYLQWLQKETADYHFEKDDILLQSIVGFLSAMLMQLVDDATKIKGISLEDSKSLMRTLVNKLPGAIKQKLTDNRTFCKKLGIKTANIVTMGNLDFDADQLWSAIAKAVINGKDHVKPLKTSNQLVLKRDVSKKNSIRLSGALTGCFSDSVIGLLDKSNEQRRKALIANPDWLDMPLLERKVLIEKIVATASPSDRMKIAQEARDASAAFYYSSLESKLEQREQLSLCASSLPTRKFCIHGRTCSLDYCFIIEAW